jgi:hypothetical protein
VLPYGVVTARNLVVSHAGSATRAGARRRVADAERPEEPDEKVLGDEERLAMITALAQLPEAERNHLMAYEVDEVPAAGLAAPGSPASSARVKLARSRAKLRVEYVIALRKVELPTPRCRPVLIALSAGDVARQRTAGAGEHLLACSTCADLSDPLTQRSRGSALFMPIALARWLRRAVRSHPVATTATAAVGAAAIVGAVALGARNPQPALPSSAPPSTAAIIAAPPAVIDHLVWDGSVVTIGAGGSLRALAGRTVVGTGISVQSVPTHNGFWVGSDANHRIWVQLVGPLRTLKVVTGAHVSFNAHAVVDSASFPGVAGVGGEDDVLLRAQGLHLEVLTQDLSVAP